MALEAKKARGKKIWFSLSISRSVVRRDSRAWVFQAGVGEIPFENVAIVPQGRRRIQNHKERSL
ncbi:MAG: hypothetical protein DMG35_17095 [Acidobacteria bacterium]|nr:MAG: hypothetical protein AUH86_10290 [Acidobacteria bacterium 13_1_40CM_4_58_4]PYT58616.1 MAG: hypothetical protein DMG35_17095 [Acidobacteriota bacterium]